jgi:hypothetical protein
MGRRALQRAISAIILRWLLCELEGTVDCAEQRQNCSEVYLVDIRTNPVISIRLSRVLFKRFMYRELYVPFCTRRIVQAVQEFRF